MPYDAVNGVLYGVDADDPENWALNALMSSIATAFNDPKGRYYEALGLSESRRCIVTGAAKVATSFYKGSLKNPTVIGWAGKGQAMSSGKKVDGTEYKGQRIYCNLNFDMGVFDASPNSTDPSTDNAVDEAQLDRRLAGFFRSYLRRDETRDALRALGLNSIEVEPDEEAQRVAAGRNPHLVTCLVQTLDDYSP